VGSGSLTVLCVAASATIGPAAPPPNVLSVRCSSRSGRQLRNVGTVLMRSSYLSNGLHQLPLTHTAPTTIGTSTPVPPTTLLVSSTSSLCTMPIMAPIRSMWLMGQVWRFLVLALLFIPTPCCNLVLNNVLHVPDATKNLISIHKFTLDNDMLIEFHPFYFLIKD
jgi:hypothetical protein